MVVAASPFNKEKEDTTIKNKIFRVLLGNMISFSPKIENYFFRPGVNKKNHLFGLVEAHKTLDHLESLKSKFSGYGRSCVLNPATLTGRSESGTHGGELMSARNDIDFVKFQDHVLQ